MNDLEYWQALKNFGDNYDEYKNDVVLTGNNEIPNTLAGSRYFCESLFWAFLKPVVGRMLVNSAIASIAENPGNVALAK
jgi:hypothetical protein